MYKDLRIRNANKATSVPPAFKAYIFKYTAVDSYVFKVILAPSFIVANQRIRDFSIENDLDFFWQFVQEDDFEVACSNNVLPR